jgi:hypothetical protein
VGEGEVDCATTVDANALINNVATTIDLADVGTGRRLKLQVTRHPNSLPVRIEPAQFRRAVSHLIRYLAHHSPGEEAKVALSVFRCYEDGLDRVRILVGSGTAAVTADNIQRLFDRAVRGGLPDHLFELGPAVSLRLIEALGGALRVRQGQNEVAFQITLRLAFW